MEIRALQPDDHAALHALWVAAGLPIKEAGRDGAAAFADQLGFHGSCFLGAFEGGDLVGAVLANHNGRKGWINRLAVAPDHRRRGIANDLVREAEARLRTDGIEITAALVYDHNASSLALFEGLGYRPHRDVIYLTRRDRPDA